MPSSFDEHFQNSPLARHRHERRGGGALSTRLISLNSPAHVSNDPPTSELVVGLVLKGTAGARWGWDGALDHGAASRRPGTLGVTPVGASGRFEVDGPSRILIVALPYAALSRRLEPDVRAPRDFGRLHDVYGDHPQARRLCVRLWAAAGRTGFGRDLVIDALAEDLLSALAGIASGRLPDRPPAPLSAREIARVMSRADADDADVGALADAAAMPVRTFRRRFQAAMGEPPHRWLTRRRIERARQLLRQDDAPLSLLALDLGFASQAHFTEAFRRSTGSTPGRYRRGREG